MNEPDNLVDNQDNQKRNVSFSCPDNKYDYPLVKISKYIYLIWHFRTIFS